MNYTYGSTHLLNTKGESIRLTNGEKVPMAGSGEIIADTLIQLSGGVDSTYVLWKWLVENPDKIAIVHHIELKSYEGRYEMELQAIDVILKWLDSNGLKNYIYLQNTFDYGNIPSSIYDVELCGFHAGFILRSVRFIDTNKVHIPVYGATTEREERRRKVLSFTARREIDCIYPLYGREKWEIIEELPEELFNLTWYCRSPLNNKKCGICFTCREVEKSKEIITENKLKNYLGGL